MAMSGNFESAFASGYRVGIDWRAHSQSASSNSSIVEVTLYLRSTGSSWTINSSQQKTVAITIDGQTFSGTAGVALSGNQKKTIFTASKTVYHDSNGNKSLGISGKADIKITFGSGYVGTVSTSSTVTLDQINLNSPPSLSGSAWTDPSGTIPENTGNITISWNAASDAQNNVRGYRVYRYVNGGHNHTLWPAGNSLVDDISWCGEGTSIYYKIWAYDAHDAYSGEINSNTVTKNTFRGANFTGHSNDVSWGTTSFSLYVDGASNTNGNGTFYYYYYSDDVTIYNSGETTSKTGTINIWRDLDGGGNPGGMYIKQSDLKNKFGSSNFNGRLHVGIRTKNAWGTYKWNGGSIYVDLRTGIVVSGSTSINSNSYYRIGNTDYLVPGRKQITLNWPAARDPLGTGISYRVEQSPDNGSSWSTLLNSTTATSYAFDLNISGRPNYKFRVIARNGYGYERTIDGAPGGTLYTYNSPSVSITGSTRTSDKLSVSISTGISTDIPGNAIKSLRWTFGSKNGTLSANASSFDITGLSQTDSGSFNVIIEDNHGSSLGQGAVTVSGTLPQFYPMLSLRRNGVGINCIPDDTAKLHVRGGMKIDGVNINSIRNMGKKIITINGDANTYYPVQFTGNANWGFATNRISISRYYNWKAPDSWNTATHKGGLTLTFTWAGDGTWGGNSRYYTIEEFSETYTTMVGGMLNTTSGMLVWLRGGGAEYQIDNDYGGSLGVNIHLGNFTASDGTVYGIRNNTEAVGREVTDKFCVRTDQLYDTGSRVLTQRDKTTSSSFIGKVAHIENNGVLEIAEYIDFHHGWNTSDYDMRLQCLNYDGNYTIRFQNKNGHVEVGCQNNGHAHYVTDRESHWFNRNVKVQGEIYASHNYNQRVLYENGTFYGFHYNDWLRATGSGGVYWQAHGGGWNMEDSTWMRVYGGKSIYCPNTIKTRYIDSTDGANLDILSNGVIFFMSRPASYQCEIGKREWNEITFSPSADNVGNIGTNNYTWNTLKSTNKSLTATLDSSKAHNISPYEDKEYLYDTYKNMNLYMMNTCSTEFTEEYGEEDAEGKKKIRELEEPRKTKRKEIKLVCNAEELPMMIAPKNKENETGNESVELGAMVTGLVGAFSYSAEMVESLILKIEELENRLNTLEGL